MLFRSMTTIRPFDLPTRLWTYLAEKALGERASNRWQHLNKKELNRLVNILSNDTYQIAGRAAFKDEFVTCGGVSLSLLIRSHWKAKTSPTSISQERSLISMASQAASIFKRPGPQPTP